jgi:signal recognition particle receptor subunit beta
MAVINMKKKEIQVKIVYYGPGRSGKTTNLLYIYSKFNSQIQSKLVSIDTFGDRTVFFDFMPFNLGKLSGFDIKVQLYTVPGQPKYDATRRVVLNGVDGLVFVADMEKSQRKENIASLKNLHQNLLKYNKNIFRIPLVFQYNKADLKTQNIPVMPVEMLSRELNARLQRPYVAASALTGKNVALTLKKITSMTISNLKNA